MIKARRTYSIIFLSFLSIVVFSQTNLVPNPSFEFTISCPLGPDDATKCQSWSSYRLSPDYFNSCDPFSNNVSTPYNFGGYQIPKSGNAYMGVATYFTKTQYPNGREYVGAKLTNTLVVSQKYFFSMKCVGIKSALGPCNCYSDKLGVTFSRYPYNALNPYPIVNSAKVFANAIINDTVNWVAINGSFIADSAYQYIILGNFFDDNSTDTLIFDSDPNCLSAYYFIDDVCLSTDSNFTYSYNPTSIDNINSNRNFGFYPNPVENFLFIENNKQFENYKIYDLIGNEMKLEIMNDRIDFTNIAPGIYFLSCTRNSEVYKYKIIKK